MASVNSSLCDIPHGVSSSVVQTYRSFIQDEPMHPNENPVCSMPSLTISSFSLIGSIQYNLSTRKLHSHCTAYLTGRSVIPPRTNLNFEPRRLATILHYPKIEVMG